MSGFVAIHRSAFDHPILKDGERFRAWFWMVARAAWKPTRFDVHGKIVTLDRGQFSSSVREMADAWGWSKSAVDRFLTRLKTETMIETDSGTGRLIITIRNYDKYQSSDDDDGTPSGTPSGTAAGQQRDIKEEFNKGITVEEEANASPSRSRAPRSDAFVRPDWADPQVWTDFKANRKAKRLTNTPTAYSKFLKDMEKLSDDEWPPGRLLEAIVGLGWAAAYDPRPSLNRNQRNGSVNNTPRDNRDGFTRAIHDVATSRSRPASSEARRPDDGDDRDDRERAAPRLAGM